MTHEAIDPRILRTQKLLREALIELTAERGFDEVTVGDIAKRAGVNRVTFYRHYQDKYDLLEQILRETLRQFASDLGPPGEFVKSIDPQNPPARWVRLFEHFAENERFYRTLLGRKGSSWFVAKLRDYFVGLMDEREQARAQLPVFQGKIIQSKMPRTVVVALAANLLISSLEWWLESGQGYSPKQMASWFLELAIDGYVHALGL